MEADEPKQVPFAESPLDAWRGARKPVEPKRVPKPKKKGQKKSASVGPAIRRAGPITIEFN
jgi:hypothetical protein